MANVTAALGLMSGTSMDGIDIALIETDGERHVAPGPSETVDYTPGLRALYREVLDAARTLERRDDRPAPLDEFEREITDAHMRAVAAFLTRHGLAPGDIGVIGFHGQTVLHRPEKRLTVQLGDGARLADGLGIRVVSDLRAADVAAGGQGAPLVPVYHSALAAGLGSGPRAFLNIGGVANLTYIADGAPLVAFDTGPGNALLDDWVLRHLGTDCDRDGALARSGHVDEARLARLLDHAYFAAPAPKSLDRNDFSLDVLDGLSPEDGAATLVAFTSAAVARAVAHLPAAPASWVVCGGGRRNPAIMHALRGRLGVPVETAEAVGLDGDAIEAEAFAYMAVRRLANLAITFPSTTGVAEPLTGGVVHEPAR